LRDRSLGVLFFVLSIIAMVGYFWLLFLSPEETYLGKTLSEWAIIIPVVIIVYAVLIVVAWIGWALASTAPPLPVTGEPSENQKEAD
jgi:hypothetical protein